jgi:hypothetical protein
MSADQWLKLDAFLPARPFSQQLMERFGLSGLGMWVAFLAACKRQPTQGRIAFISYDEALQIMGVYGCCLLDNEGQPWTLEDFFNFTGRKRQTRRTMRGRTLYVTSTHWEDWQETRAIALARERKRRWRAKSGTFQERPENEKENEKENESKSVTMSRSKGNGEGEIWELTDTSDPAVLEKIKTLRQSMEGKGR